ncbi:hypothetical protein, partial [Escherichia coli]
TLWFPLLIWWTPLCLIRQILTRRFRLYAYGNKLYIYLLVYCNSTESTGKYRFDGNNPDEVVVSVWKSGSTAHNFSTIKAEGNEDIKKHYPVSSNAAPLKWTALRYRR